MRISLSYATKYELHTAFFNSKEGTMTSTIITKMGHPKSNTPLQVGNRCADGIINITMKQLCYKSMNMHFYRLKYCECQGKFQIHWHCENDNLEYYFTKNPCTLHHLHIFSKYILHLHRPDFKLEVPWKHVFGKGCID